MTTRSTIKSLLGACCIATTYSVAAQTRDTPNILFITADDLNHDTPGCFGGVVAGVTPNLDRLADEGLRLMRTHVTVAVCQPSRQSMMTGCYPQTHGGTGFYPIGSEIPTLQEQLKAHGYYLGILGKVTHLQPAKKFPWDFQRDMPELGGGRDPERYASSMREFLEAVRASGRPFFLMANSHDPHRPFSGSAGERQQLAREAGNVVRGNSAYDLVHGGAKVTPVEVGFPEPSRTFRPDEIVVPGFLPDLPDIRMELAQYYSSVRRCDETVGELLRVLADTGMSGDTIVVFLSDNGVALPFAKSNCYLASTLTPCIVRWPGKVAPGSVDAESFVSGADFMPTLLEVVGAPLPAGMDGRSFAPLLRGQRQDARDSVVTCYFETSMRKAYPMRCLQTARFGYIFNAWADGTTAYRAEPMAGLTFKAMTGAAEDNPEIARRVRMLVHRVPEEFYDLQRDPDALRNLIDEPEYQEDIRRFRAQLLAWMQKTQDSLSQQFADHIETRR